MAAYRDSADGRGVIRWSHGLVWGALPVAIVLAVVAIMPATFVALARNTWSTLGYSHGPLVAAISLALVFVTGRRLRPVAELHALPFVLLILGLAAWTGVRFAAVDVAQQLLAVWIAWLALWCAYGARGALAFAFPLAFAVLSIPVWDALGDPLQRATTLANSLALGVFGIPAHIVGNYVTVPAGTFEIADGCSGLHFFIVALTVSSLHAYLQRYTLKWWLITIGLAVGLALVTNWIRVLVIIWRGNATAMQTSLVEHHYWFGWYLFAAALVVFFVIVRQFPIAGLPSQQAATDALRRQAPGFLGVALPVLTLVVCGAYVAAKWSAWGASVPAVALTPAAPQWTGPDVSADLEWEPGFRGAAVARAGAYRRRDAGGPETPVVHVTRLAYTTQEPGRKLIGYGSGLAPPEWGVLEDRALDGYSRYAELRAPSGARWAAIYWYAVGERTTSDRRIVAVLQALNGFRVPETSGVVVAAARCDGPCASARGTLQSFVDAHPGLRPGVP